MADVVLQFLYRVRIWFVYRAFKVYPEETSPPGGGGNGDTWKVRYTKQIRTRYRNWRTTSATQLQPSKSLCYIGCTSTWWQHDCWLSVQTLYAIYILTPERISQRHVQNGRGTTFSWPILYISLEFVTGLQAVQYKERCFSSSCLTCFVTVSEGHGFRLRDNKFQWQHLDSTRDWLASHEEQLLVNEIKADEMARCVT